MLLTSLNTLFCFTWQYCTWLEMCCKCSFKKWYCQEGSFIFYI